MQVADAPGLGHLARHVVADDLRHLARHGQQAVQVDAGVVIPWRRSMWMASSLLMLPLAPGA
jgi:hypothetical protein